MSDNKITEVSYEQACAAYEEALFICHELDMYKKYCDKQRAIKEDEEFFRNYYREEAARSEDYD